MQEFAFAVNVQCLHSSLQAKLLMHNCARAINAKTCFCSIENNLKVQSSGKYWLVWLVFGFSGPETIFQSTSGCLPERERKRREKIEESKNVQTTPTRIYCKRNRPLPYINPNCRTPRH